MVQPSQPHVAPCVKGVEWGLGTRDLRMVAAFLAGILEVTQKASVVPRRKCAAIGTTFQSPHTTRSRILPPLTGGKYNVRSIRSKKIMSPAHVPSWTNSSILCNLLKIFTDEISFARTLNFYYVIPLHCQIGLFPLNVFHCGLLFTAHITVWARAPSFLTNCFRPKFFIQFISSNPIRLSQVRLGQERKAEKGYQKSITKHYLTR